MPRRSAPVHSPRMWMRRLAFGAILGLLGGAAAGCGDDGSEPEPQTDSAELIGLITRCHDLSAVPGMATERVDADGGNVHLRIGVMAPAGEPKGDVLFLHGFADRFDNHLPLFEGWRKLGLRVIAFDYPSHGETCGRGLDLYRIRGLAQLASFVEERTRPDHARPLVLAGWSTGGLVSVRLLQEPSLALGRPVSGAFLLAPGVDVKVLVGKMQFVTEETLTHHPDPPHRGPISPVSPLLTPLFSADLLVSAHRAREAAYPKDVPTFVVTGGQDDDVYANTAGVTSWVKARQREGGQLYGLSCGGGRHELDNEAEPMGDDVRTSGARFAAWAVSGTRESLPDLSSDACESY